MDLEQFVNEWVSAWNEQNIDRLLSFFHKNGAIYDGFWMETCSGEDLAEYFQSVIEDDKHVIERIGDVIPTDDGVAYRYHAFADTSPREFLFNGAEIIVLRDGQIASISDFYCDPAIQSLQEVSNWVARHHGRIRTLGSGLSAVRATQFRDKLSELMDSDKLFLDPNLTATEVAHKVGCSVDHLNQVVIAEMGASFYSFLDKQRAHYARQLLLEPSDDPDYVYDVSAKAGFRTFANFVRTFDRFFNQRPEEFYRENSR